MCAASHEAQLSALKIGQSTDSAASSPILKSVQANLNDLASEESSQSSATTPGLEPQVITSSDKRNVVLYPLELVPRSKPTKVKHGEKEFLEDLGNYIALGSLTLRPGVGGRAYLHQTRWTESSDTWLAFHDYCDLKDTHPVSYARILADGNWARVFARKHQWNGELATMRVYILPDDVGRRYINRDYVHLRNHLMKLLNGLDKSPLSWEGQNRDENHLEHYSGESSNNDSLFYLFNTIPSPAARPPPVSCSVSSEAIRSILESDELRGLKTKLYPYQRRTVAAMIKREVQPERTLDPRFQSLEGPTGQRFYYDRETGVLLRDQRTYEEARGGILGESMGLGKTLICLATIIATKGHWPEIPPEHSLGLLPVRSKVGSLMQMAAAAVGRTQVPWRAIFHDLFLEGEDHKNCLATLEDNVGSYIVSPPVTRRSHRPSQIQKGKTIRLTTATLIIVPQNLLSQWKDEISLHVEEQFLEVFYLDSDTILVPSAARLMKYDIILMSRQRFEREMVPTGTAKARFKSKTKFRGGCSCSLDEDCHCSIEEHQSPLMEVHFLRIIMDEGHEFSSGHKNSAYWALQRLHVDRKWIVSGTPASGLLGVEVGTATFETSKSVTDCHRSTNFDLLEARRNESALIQERKDLEKLGAIVAGFLQIKPWANSKEHDPASWSKYIMPYSDGRRKVRSLKTLLESLVVRHRIEDLEADIQLPPLHNRVVYLQPSWHDKLSLNLFTLTLTANAVTSERVDEDYMFHTKNRRDLNRLINNLRQSGFYWTSFSPSDVAKTIEVSQAYLEKQSDPGSVCKETDRLLLKQAIEVGEIALESPSWRSFADLHEMGMFVEQFPETAQDAWSLVHRTGDGPLLIGATQLSKAQNWVNAHLYVSDPSHGLAMVGVTTMQKLWHGVQQQAVRMFPDDHLSGEANDARRKPRKKSKSGINGTPKLTEKQTMSRAKTSPSPRKTKNTQLNALDDKVKDLKPALKPALKSSPKEKTVDPFPPDSPLARSTISGTASAKLSYLLDQVVLLHQEEKILIFYEGDQIAYYIAQALDLIDVQYLIYTKTLSLARQNAYINTFNTTETFRVLLMNVHQAAHGLHIAAASRVFFVNPVWQPNVEAQAIKRAHRIGQLRPVYVETLVLKDTLEDQMLRRRKGMTAQEHQKAEKSLLDDDTMSTIIKNAQFIPLAKDQSCDADNQVARLSAPQQLFGRAAKNGGHLNDPDADLILDSPQSMKPSRKRQLDIVVSDYVPDQRESPSPERSSANLTPRFAGENDLAESSVAPDTTCKRRNSSEHAPELNLSPSSKRRAANIPFRTVGEANAPESSTAHGLTRKRKSNSEYAPEFAASSPPRRKALNVSFRPFDTPGSLESDMSASSPPHNSSPAPSATPARQTPAAAGAVDARPARRVGFNLGDSEDEPRSLFGGKAFMS